MYYDSHRDGWQLGIPGLQAVVYVSQIGKSGGHTKSIVAGLKERPV